MVTPNQKEIDAGTPTIMLAGQAWPIPILAPRQNRTVVPAMLRLIDKFQSAGPVNGLDNAAYDDLLNAVYTALNRAHPSLSRADFEEMPITTIELTEAISVLTTQTGLLRMGEANVEKKTTK